MKTTNGDDGHNLLQYYTVHSVPQPYGHKKEGNTTNTVRLYCVEIGALKMNANRLFDTDSIRHNRKAIVETATVRKLIMAKADLLYIVELLASFVG